MKSIELENFRRFKKLDKLEFSPITIFVGENNSGKSTVVKSILAINDFMQQDFNIKDAEDCPKFYFNKNYFAHIGTFERASYKKEKQKIRFSISNEYQTVNLYVENGPKRDDNIWGNVVKIETIDTYRTNTKIVVDFKTRLVDIIFYKEKTDLYNNVVKHIEENTKLKKNDYRNHFLKMQQDYVSYFDTINKDYYIGFKLDDIFAQEMAEHDSILSYEGIYRNISVFLTSEIFRYIYHLAEHKNNKSKNNNIDLEFANLLCKYRGYSMFAQRSWMKSDKIAYIYAHSVSQNVICSVKDRSDYFVQTINSFADSTITKRKEYKIYSKICKWMKQFSVGDSYEITNIAGEANIVLINNGDEKTNLADKGMGSIQLMVLFFRLGLLINSFVRNEEYRDLVDITIIIEEPEQNLHPRLQSKLAELFFELHDDYGFNFIIETHSEYLIRNCQVIVGDKYHSEEEMLENPFKIYYFPSNGLPYDMGFELGGGFKENFGDGFFNEASRLQKTIKQNKKKYDDA